MVRSTYPELPEQFLLPKEWQRDAFINPDTSHHIHYNYALAGRKPESAKANILILPGLSEFGEKYIEFTRECLAKKYNFYIIDWAYQGRSSRYIPNAHKRHSNGYKTDISDLHYMTQNVITNEKPIIIMGHSMGAHIGLRYLQEFPGVIDAAGFAAPMVGIKDLKYTKSAVEWFLKNLPSIHTCYIPGGKDWYAQARSSDGKDIFSSDPLRDKIHNAWCMSVPELQIGNITIRWVFESLKSCKLLNEKFNISKIKIPVFIATAEHEKLVDNKETEKFAKQLSDVEIIELPNAKHEILMETDEIRSIFTKKFFDLVKKVS